MLFGVLFEPKKKTVLSCSAPRAFSFRRGRYIEDSLVSALASRSSSQNKSSKEKSSRSPLRATTLESNVKKSSRVEFREPLASHRLVLRQFTIKEKYAKIRIKLIVIACLFNAQIQCRGLWCNLFVFSANDSVLQELCMWALLCFREHLLTKLLI